MGTRGRKSGAELSTLRVISVKRPGPPADLTETEQQIWREIVGCMPAGFFRRAQFPILANYARHVARAALLAGEINRFEPAWLRKEGGVQRFDLLLRMAERETRAGTACARSLRLTIQSQRHPSTAGTAMRSVSQYPPPWKLDDDDDEDEEESGSGD